MCRTFEPLIAIDRFARLVAVLLHYSSSSGRPLPELPSHVTPQPRILENVWSVNSVFAGPAKPAVTVDTGSLFSAPEPPPGGWWSGVVTWLREHVLLVSVVVILLIAFGVRNRAVR